MKPTVVTNGGKESIEEVKNQVFVRFRFYGGPVGACQQPLLMPIFAIQECIPLNLAKGIINDIGYPGLFMFCSNFCSFHHCAVG